MTSTVRIRSFCNGDEPALWRVFHDTIHVSCRGDYSADQIIAWAPDEFDEDRWIKRMRAIDPLVAESEGEIAGYADVQANGYIDHFYCHHSFQRQGVGSALMEAIESRAGLRGLAQLHSDVSITARPFFEKKGFEVVRQKSVHTGGQKLINFRMRKKISITR